MKRKTFQPRGIAIFATALATLATTLAALAQPAAATPPPAKPAAQKEAPPEMVRFEAPDASFAISYPKTWEKAPEALANAFSGAALVMVNVGEPGGQPDVLAVSATPATPLEQIQNPRQPNAPPVYRRDLKAWNKAKRDSVTSRPGAKLVTENQATVGGAPGLRLVFDANDAAGNTARFIQIFFEKGPTEYHITFVTDPKRFAKFLPIEQAITRSFVIAPKPGDAAAAAATPPATTTDTAPAPATTEKPTATATTEPPKPAATDTGPAAAFESAELGVKLTYPNAWAPRKSTAPGILLMLLPAQVKPGARPSTLTLTADPFTGNAPPSIKELTDLALATFKATASDAKVTESTDVTIGRTRARRVVLAGQNSITKADTRALYLFLPHAKNTLTLSGQSSAEDFNALKESFDAVVNSIELTTPAQPKKPQ